MPPNTSCSLLATLLSMDWCWCISSQVNNVVSFVRYPWRTFQTTLRRCDVLYLLFAQNCALNTLSLDLWGEGKEQGLLVTLTYQNREAFLSQISAHTQLYVCVTLYMFDFILVNYFTSNETLVNMKQCRSIEDRKSADKERIKTTNQVHKFVLAKLSWLHFTKLVVTFKKPYPWARNPFITCSLKYVVYTDVLLSWPFVLSVLSKLTIMKYSW